jgi:hypothetical protein
VCSFRRLICSSLGVVGLLLLGCANERAVRVTFDIDVPADAVCVAAGDGRTPLFLVRYAANEFGADASLTFAAGSAMRQSALVGAYAVAAGQVTGTAHLQLSFDGENERSMRIARCRPDIAGLGLRRSGTFAALAPNTRLVAADVDADGRQELLAVAVDGSLAVLDAEDAELGSRRATELLSADGQLAFVGDFDDDCRVDLLVVAALGVLRIVGADGSSPAPIGGANVRAAVILAPVRGAATVIAIGGPRGLRLYDVRGAELGVLSTDAISFVAAADLNGDGASYLIAGGSGATHLFFGDDGGIREESGAGVGLLAGASGPAAVGDFDGDALADVAIADGTALRVLSFGSGELGSLATSIAVSAPSTLVAADLDGDCVDELALRDGDGTIRVVRGGASLSERPGPGVPATELAVGDVDGDGASELALLGAGGSVTLWRP